MFIVVLWLLCSLWFFDFCVHCGSMGLLWTLWLKGLLWTLWLKGLLWAHREGRKNIEGRESLFVLGKLGHRGEMAMSGMT